MGSLDLDHSLKRLGNSIRTFSLDRNVTLKWSESVKLVFEDFDDMKEDASCENESLGALEGELILLKAAYALSNVNRRLSLSKLLDLQGNVRVLCRVRPCLSCETEVSPLEVVSPAEIRASCHGGEPPKSFKFDKVFSPTASQDEVFWEVQPAIKSAMDGCNVCILAYGQTGTGKTYTMEGNKSLPGIVPRSLRQLFKDKGVQSSDQTSRLTLSMVEIYKGSLRDLLVPRSTRINDPPPKSLNIHMSVSDNVEVENLTEYVVENADDALKLYRKGLRARSTCTTSSNETSSRSHCLVRVNISRSVAEKGKPAKTTVSKVWFIDLGGSERFFKTQVWGKPLEEGKAINVSLTALGDVICALQKKQPHIPYRNSKLTQIIKDCLGCTSRVVMLVHASPKVEDQGETVCTLNFASRTRGIHLNRDFSELIRQRDSRISGIVDKMQALEGECQRLSVDIQALESTLKEKKAELETNGGNTNKAHQLHDNNVNVVNREVAAVRPDAVLHSVPRFMTPTISSLCKNRLAMGAAEFEVPVWPELMKKPLKQVEVHHGLLNNCSSLSSRSQNRSRTVQESSPQFYADMFGQRVRKSDHHQQQVTPWQPESHEISPKSNSSAKKNVAKVQRRLTLECSSKVRVEQLKTKLGS